MLFLFPYSEIHPQINLTNASLAVTHQQVELSSLDEE
jgi:hypothetical protein